MQGTVAQAGCPLQQAASRRSPWLSRRQQLRQTIRWARHAVQPRAAAADDSSGDATSLPPPRPRKPSQLEPSFWLSREGAVEAQLKALRHNNFPSIDHGIETLYRFAGFDPFARSDYFGVVTLDLGQFERFRRIMYTPYFRTLVNLSDWRTLSALEVGEDVWVARVHAVNAYRREERTYSLTMERRFGGPRDGVWYCSKLQADGCTAKTLYGII